MKKYYVYILQSLSDPDQTYVGFTNHLSERLKKHNDGLCLYTSRYAPWKIETYLVFSDYVLALNFEKYLKTSTGKILMSRRLVHK